MPWCFPLARGECGLLAFEKRTAERCFGMKHKANPEFIDVENPEWTEEDFQRARRAAEILPKLLGPEVAFEMLKPRGRPKAATTKAHVNIRLDADVLEAFKATGRGWQTRINRALREWLKDRKPGKSHRA
jgi:uncharacterized protein (DUF4415 family)